LAEYNGYQNKIVIICPIHGQFLQTPDNHLRGQGCPHCAITRIAKLHSQTSEKFLQDAAVAHGDRYDYSKVVFEKNNQKVIIICKKHGEFLQTPHIHTYEKAGCYKCGREKVADKQRKSTEEYVKNASIIHNNTYDYSDTEYIGAHSKIDIICNTHGKFQQKAGDHAKCHSCPKCTNNISKEETKWLDSLNIPEEYRQQLLYIRDTKVKTDAYDPITNTIYEYWGDFWHGNPEKYNLDDINPRNKKTYRELYEETQTKRKLILDNGYTLIEIWGSDFKKSLIN
jgi:DNA-directed RNA polymerase subunit M/transcription elongation factor TFIIS